jgi:hypothetical protein
MISLDTKVWQKEDNIVSDMNGEKVMLSIQNGKYYNFGEIGGEIWQQMEKPIVVKQMIDKLLLEYNVERNICEEQVLNFLNHLRKENLVEIEG